MLDRNQRVSDHFIAAAEPFPRIRHGVAAGQAARSPSSLCFETQASRGYRPTDKRIAELADEGAFAEANMKR